MVSRFFAIFLVSALFVSGAAKKTTASGRGENEDLILNVTIYTDSAAVKEALGDDLGGHYIVAQVKVEPKYTKEITIDRDDFLLRTDKDGDRTKPMAPNQVAGTGGLVLMRNDGPSGQGAERSRGVSAEERIAGSAGQYQHALLLERVAPDTCRESPNQAVDLKRRQVDCGHAV